MKQYACNVCDQQIPEGGAAFAIHTEQTRTPGGRSYRLVDLDKADAHVCYRCCSFIAKEWMKDDEKPEEAPAREWATPCELCGGIAETGHGGMCPRREPAPSNDAGLVGRSQTKPVMGGTEERR